MSNITIGKYVTPEYGSAIEDLEFTLEEVTFDITCLQLHQQRGGNYETNQKENT